MSKATIFDIAKDANTSIGTVDRVIHGRPGVSAKTIERVNAAIEKLGYQPNLLARHLKTDKEMEIGVVLPMLSQDDGYWKLIKQGIEKGEGEYYQYGLHITYFHYDKYNARSFLEQINSLMTQNIDVAILVPSPFKETYEPLQRLLKKIPYCFIDSDLTSSDRFFYTGQNAKLSGSVAAELMNHIVAPQEKVIIVEPTFDEFHLSKRREGFLSVTHSKTIIAGPLNDESQKSVIELVTTINREKNISGIFFVNSSSGYLLPHLFEGGCNPKAVIAYDLTPANKILLEERKISFLLGQRPEAQGFAALRAAFKKEVAKTNKNLVHEMPIEILTPLNYANYLDDLQIY